MSRKIFILAFFIVAFYTNFHAQSQSITAGLSIDSYLSAEVDYSKKLSIGKFEIEPFVKIKLPVFLYLKKSEISAGELQTGLDFNSYRSEKFEILHRAFVSASYQSQLLGQMLPVDFYADIAPAFRFKSKHYIGAKFGLRQNLFVSVHHSEYVNERFDDIVDKSGNAINGSAQNGIYPFMSTQLHYGLTSSFQLNSKLNLLTDLLVVSRPGTGIGFIDGTKYGFVPFLLYVRLEYAI